MKQIIYSLILLLGVSCQTVKRHESPKSQSLDKKITITINKADEKYSVKVDWLEIREKSSEVEESGTKDCISIPEIIATPNNWAIARVVELFRNNPKTEILIDNELIKVPEGFGITAKIFITPIDQTKVRAKGVTSISKCTEEELSDHMEFPFSGIFILGKPKTIYHRTENK